MCRLMKKWDVCRLVLYIVLWILEGAAFNQFYCFLLTTNIKVNWLKAAPSSVYNVFYCSDNKDKSNVSKYIDFYSVLIFLPYANLGALILN